jgi:NAD(P)-dependent dehydrogenase (short-subunit alcohol dehydrogenase family)
MSRRARLVAAKAAGVARRVLAVLTGPTATERVIAAATGRLENRSRLVGKRVLITGSTRGIGRALADGFARQGATVVVHGRREVDARQTASAISGPQLSNLRAVGIGADLSSAGAGRRLVDRAISELGGLDLVVNNAAIHDPTRKPIWVTSSEEMHEILRVNVLAPFDVSVSAIAGMLARGIEGRVINISTDAANPAQVAAGGVASYGISKFAVEGLSCYLAAEAPGITVATLRPGAIDTDMVRPLFPRDERWLMLPPESVVPAVLHLATAPREHVHGRVFEQLTLLRELAEEPTEGIMARHL